MHPSTSLRVPCPICRTVYQIVPRTHRDLAMSPMTWRQLLRWTNTDRELLQRHCRYLLLVAPLLASTILAWRWMYGYRCTSERRTVAGVAQAHRGQAEWGQAGGRGSRALPLRRARVWQLASADPPPLLTLRYWDDLWYHGDGPPLMTDGLPTAREVGGPPMLRGALTASWLPVRHPTASPQAAAAALYAHRARARTALGRAAGT